MRLDFEDARTLPGRTPVAFKRSGAALGLAAIAGRIVAAVPDDYAPRELVPAAASAGILDRTAASSARVLDHTAEAAR